MFGHGYFGAAYFGPAYFGPAAAVAAVPVVVSARLQRRFQAQLPRRTRKRVPRTIAAILSPEIPVARNTDNDILFLYMSDLL